MTLHPRVRKMSCYSRMRKGMTLVELLTVLGIVSVLALLILPSVKGLLTDRKSTSAATMVRNFLEAARSRAVGTGHPVAVVFERMSSVPADINNDGLINESDLVSGRLTSATAIDPVPSGSSVDANFLPYNSSIRLSMAEQPLPITLPNAVSFVPMSNAVVQAWFSEGTADSNAIYNQRDSLDFFTITVSAQSSLYLIPGSEISLGKTASRHVIVGVNGPKSAFAILNSSAISKDLEQAIPSSEYVVGRPAYPGCVIYPRLRPINGPAIQLPKGMCVDLSISGFATSGNLTPRDARMRFSSAWLYTSTAAPDAFELRPIYAVFGSDGSVRRVYCNGIGSGDVPVETADDIFFHIGKVDLVTVPVVSAAVEQNMTDSNTYIVRLSPKSGAISVAPNNLEPVAVGASVGDVLEISRRATYAAPLTGQ